MKWRLTFVLCIGLQAACAQAPADTLRANRLFQEAEALYMVTPDSATGRFEEARRIYREAGMWGEYTVSCLALYATHRLREDYEAAGPCLEEAVRSARQHLGDSSLHHVVALNNLADYHYMKGDFEGALETYQKAYGIALARFAEEAEFVNGMRISLGSCLRQLGDFDAALRFNLAAVEGITRQGGAHTPLAGISFQNIATNYRHLQDYPAAAGYLQKALTAFADDPAYFREKISSHHGLSSLYLAQDKPDSAEYHLRQSQKLQSRFGNYLSQVTLDLQAELALKKRQAEEALGLYHQALGERLRVFSSRERHIEVAKSYQRIAAAYLQIGRKEDALCAYEDCLEVLISDFDASQNVHRIPVANSVNYPRTAIEVLDGKAQILAARNQTGDLEAAMACYELADSLVSRAFFSLREESARLFLSREIHPVYERAMGLCLDLYASNRDDALLAKAFHFVERSRAAVLLGSLQEVGARLSGGVPDSLLERERALRIDVAFYLDKLLNPANKEEESRERWRRVLFEKEEEYKAIIRVLEENYPTYYRLKHDFRTVPLKEVQRSLKGDRQALLEFFTGDSSISVFLVSDSYVRVHVVARDSLMEARLTSLLEHIHLPSTSPESLLGYVQDSRFLYQKLLQPLLKEGNYEHLVLIPDGRLTFLPFETLLPQEPQLPDSLEQRLVSLSYRNLPYLFHEYEIRYAYSATLLFQSPFHPSHSQRVLASFAPSYKGALQLSFTEPQAREIAEAMGGDSFLGPAATESAFKTLAPRYDLLHLVMHGQANEEAPLYARLLFSPDSSNDGALHAYELYNLQLNARMAVLVACESGFGPLQEGEGVLSLARAFRYAGCPSLVYAHWTADSRVSWQLFPTFYDQLQKGASKSGALQVARRDFLARAQPDLTHPYYWAPFVLSGADDPLYHPRPLHPAYPAAAALWMALCLWQYRRREAA